MKEEKTFEYGRVPGRHRWAQLPHLLGRPCLLHALDADSRSGTCCAVPASDMEIAL